jgi:hypothetical protein
MIINLINLPIMGVRMYVPSLPHGAKWGMNVKVKCCPLVTRGFDSSLVKEAVERRIRINAN